MPRQNSAPINWVGLINNNYHEVGVKLAVLACLTQAEMWIV